VLAGDGLLTMAFEVLSHPNAWRPAVRCALIAALANAARSGGDGRRPDDRPDRRVPTLGIGAITRLQRMKTGALIAFCLRGLARSSPRHHMKCAWRCAAMPMIWASHSRSPTICSTSRAQRKRLASLSRRRGGRKATFVSILGIERARAQAELLINQAVAHLDFVRAKSGTFATVARFVIDRGRKGA